MCMSICKHCKKNFIIEDKPKGWMANHSRWCLLNPKRTQYCDNLREVRFFIKHPENQYTKAKKEGREIPISPCKGKTSHFKGKQHTDKTKELIKQKALASNHRRLKKGTVEYKGIILDSSWELVLAKRLDEINVQWNRPTPIQWKDDKGATHHYFPDFYLPDYNLYLDPKNPQAIKTQKEKIKILKQQLPNLIIIDNIDECKNYTPVSQPPSKRSLTE